MAHNLSFAVLGQDWAEDIKTACSHFSKIDRINVVLEGMVENKPLVEQEAEELQAEFALELGETPTSSGGTGFEVRMRATDTTLGRVVYWSSAIVDETGVDYAGPGPLVSVVVSNVICA